MFYFCRFRRRLNTVQTGITQFCRMCSFITEVLLALVSDGGLECGKSAQFGLGAKNAEPWHYATSCMFHFDVITLLCGASTCTKLQYSADLNGTDTVYVAHKTFWYCSLLCLFRPVDTEGSTLLPFSAADVCAAPRRGVRLSLLGEGLYLKANISICCHG